MPLEICTAPTCRAVRMALSGMQDFLPQGEINQTSFKDENAHQMVQFTLRLSPGSLK